MSRSWLSCLETFEPSVLDCPIFHLNSLGLWGEPHQEMDFSVPSQEAPGDPNVWTSHLYLTVCTWGSVAILLCCLWSQVSALKSMVLWLSVYRCTPLRIFRRGSPIFVTCSDLKPVASQGGRSALSNPTVSILICPRKASHPQSHRSTFPWCLSAACPVCLAISLSV